MDRIVFDREEAVHPLYGYGSFGNDYHEAR